MTYSIKRSILGSYFFIHFNYSAWMRENKGAGYCNISSNNLLIMLAWMMKMTNATKFVIKNEVVLLSAYRRLHIL